jgi:hypothetical protein
MKDKHTVFLLATMFLSLAASIFSATNLINTSLAKRDVSQFLQDLVLVDVDEGEK